MGVGVSVIIPTYNRRDALIETLGALYRCEFPAGQWETIVVDDGSNDGTTEAVQEWIAATGASARYHRQTNAGPARARNQGANLAAGANLIFIDNDIVVQPDFLSGHMEMLAANPGCWVVGRIRHPPQLRETPFGRYRDDLWEEFHQTHDGAAIAETKGITAANLSLPAADFARLGGFDEGFTIASCEDWELGMRARRAGVRVLYHPGLVVLHNDWAIDLDRFCERQRLYSISDVKLWRMYGDGSPRAGMIRENNGLDTDRDGLRLTVKKLMKIVMATPVFRALLRAITGLSERLFSDSGLTRRLYRTAIAVAIFRGVRDGLNKYDQ
ncbi:MAG: glycosyltransferase [Pyrinomonadaceae bacterium]